jgi:hypothetical protein
LLAGTSGCEGAWERPEPRNVNKSLMPVSLTSRERNPRD